uniref:glucuronosyltransferase n=1 Tax=Parastrongyloides trichosuri TaxID=131310 RepID=A0A0N4ZYC4_PARTI
MKYYYRFSITIFLLLNVPCFTSSYSLDNKNTSSSILLLPSSGVYSHDAMMRQVGESFGSKESIYWLQLLIYDFSMAIPNFPENWIPLILNKSTPQSQAIISNGISLFWELNIPFDMTRPWDLRGALYLVGVLKNNRKYCMELKNSSQYKELLKMNEKIDLIVLDHFFQECVTSLLSKMNKTTIQFSNWPLSDGYISSLNIPAMPSSVPKTGTLFSGKGMSFMERVLNFLYQLLITVSRILLNFTIYYDFDSNIFEIEAKHLLYAGRSEMIMEPVRPINNRIKYFGSMLVNKENNYILKNENLTKNFSWNDLNKKKFILVTFGSISNVKYMPKKLLQILLNVFESRKYNIIWQTNTDHDEIALIPNIKVPSNVIIVKWIPLRLLYNHPKLKYVICHGGINTLNELIYFQVPFVGIPLQGDQSSNLQRLVDLNACKLITIREVWELKLNNVLDNFEKDYEHYHKRCKEIGEMIAFHKKISNNEQMFWVQWSIRHGKQILNKSNQKYFDMRMKSTIETYMLQDIFYYTVLFIIIILLLP